MKIIENGADTIIEDWGEGSGLQILDRDNPVMMTPDEYSLPLSHHRSHSLPKSPHHQHCYSHLQVKKKHFHP